MLLFYVLEKVMPKSGYCVIKATDRNYFMCAVQSMYSTCKLPLHNILYDSLVPDIIPLPRRSKSFYTS